jgi:formate hydrogenlyase subunit 6/NADH:ubiquinone oxidoreductase subunit I
VADNSDVAHRIELECVSCALCAEICPEKCIVEDVEAFVIDGEACTDCGDCVPVCPVDCIVGQRASEAPATIEACLSQASPLQSQDS